MNHPLRENLEMYVDGNRAWTRCSRCLYILCLADENWRLACKKKQSSPTHAGHLMKDLVGHFVLEQLYCPSCAALMNTELIEAQKG